MSIKDLLIRDQAAIKQQWLDLIIETYPPESREFFKNKKDRFQNPVGAVLSKQVDSLFDALLKDAADEELAVILEDFIKIRAVQEFIPSDAIGFILYLKQAVRKILEKDIESHQLNQELLEFEIRIDQLLLKAFDVYSQSREKLYEIRANELKRRSFMASRMINSNSK